MFDYSRMVGRFYEPDEKICLIFDVSNYNELRKLPEFSERWPDDESYGSRRNKFHWYDMPRAREWANEFEQGIKAYGFTDDQIHRYSDSDFSTMYRTLAGYVNDNNSIY